MKRKLFLTIIIFAFIFLLLGATRVNATETTWLDEGNYSTDWYYNDADTTGNGDDTYYISSAKDLAGLAYLLNNNIMDETGKTIIITKDIDLSGKLWVPIDELENCTLDGKNYKIKNILINEELSYDAVEENSNVGFVRNIYKTDVKNLNLYGEINAEVIFGRWKDFWGSNLSEYCYIGGLSAGAGEATITNTYSEVGINIKIKGQPDDTGWHNCDSIKVGGLVGAIEDDFTFGRTPCCIIDSKCNSNIYVNSDDGTVASCCIGGIVGWLNDLIINSWYCGNIEVNCDDPWLDAGFDGHQVAGICGSYVGGLVLNCYATGNIKVNNVSNYLCNLYTCWMNLDGYHPYLTSTIENCSKEQMRELLNNSLSETKQILEDNQIEGLELKPWYCVKDVNNGYPILEEMYDVNVEEIANGTINLDTTYAKPDEIVKINVTPNNGYKFKKLTVTTTEGNIVELTESNKFVMPHSEVNIKAKFEKEDVKVYNVIEGENQIYVINGNSDLAFRIDADYTLFNKLYIDGQEVNSSNYTIESGSTIINLKASYIETLEVGEHSLKVEFSDNGTAETAFSIKKEQESTSGETENENNIDNAEIVKDTKNQTPQTGDNIVTYFTIMVVAIIGNVAIIIVRRKLYK